MIVVPVFSLRRPAPANPPEVRNSGQKSLCSACASSAAPLLHLSESRKTTRFTFKRFHLDVRKTTSNRLTRTCFQVEVAGQLSGQMADMLVGVETVGEEPEPESEGVSEQHEEEEELTKVRCIVGMCNLTAFRTGSIQADRIWSLLC